jgi:GntR family transcriptional repressor for pyruvate dehydrogenase complex
VTEIFTRIEHSRTADEVVQQIESLILEGVLRTGDRLPGERELARQFEVSRPILRDALKALEARGLLVTRHGGGTFVADVIGQVFSRPVIELISSHRKAAAAYREDDFEAEAEVDVEFHHAVGECAHNIILLHTLRSCYRLLSEDVFQNRLLVFALPGAREMLLEQHRAIHSAIVAGDPAAARKAAMDHIAYVERTTAEAERAGDWQRVSRLRLRKRTEPGPQQKD